MNVVVCARWTPAKSLTYNFSVAPSTALGNRGWNALGFMDDTPEGQSGRLCTLPVVISWGSAEVNLRASHTLEELKAG